MTLSKYVAQFLRFFVQIVFYSGCALILYYMCHFPSLSVNPIFIYKYNKVLPMNVDSNENYYQIFINGIDTKKIGLFIKDKAGRLWVPAENLSDMKIIMPKVAPEIFNDKKYYSLSVFPGVNYTVNEADSIIKINFPASAFMPQTIIAGDPQIIKMDLPDSGVYLDYDATNARSVYTQPNNTFASYFQLGVFNEYGVGTNSFIFQNSPNTESVMRLLTTWRYDKPDKMWTLSVGDDESTSTLWSSSVNFGGVQWGTNFNTQPNFVTFPQPGYSGQATVPSTLDLYINDGLAKSADIYPGMYSIDNIPYIDGQGNMRIVTKDILGREHVVNITFYASNLLLKTGLVDYTYELGMIRQNLGLTSFDYARFIAAATKSIGLTDDLTVQWHVEGLSDQQTIGGGLFKQIGTFGVLDGFGAMSHINSGNEWGGMGMLEFQRQTPNYSFGASSQITTLYFTQQGITPGDFSPRLVNQVFGGVMFAKNSFNFNYVRQINRDQPGNNAVTATFSRNMFWNFYLSLTGTTNLGGTKNKGVFINITRSLGNQTNLTISNSVQNDQHQENIQIQRSLPPGPGYGYSLVGSTGSDINTKQASYSYQNDVGTYSAQLNESNGEETATVNAQGAIIWTGGHTYLSRNLGDNSFAVVQVPGVPNVDVSINNQVSARTDKFGNALIPDLLPYQQTAITINPNQIPLNSTVDASSITVAPYYSSGLIVRFPVKIVRNATMTVKQANGDFVPEGVSAAVSGQPPEFIVGENGQVYLTGLAASNKIDFIWDEHVCEINFTMPAPSPENPVPDLGTFVCHEVTNETAKKAALTSIENTQ